MVSSQILHSEYPPLIVESRLSSSLLLKEPGWNKQSATLNHSRMTNAGLTGSYIHLRSIRDFLSLWVGRRFLEVSRWLDGYWLRIWEGKAMIRNSQVAFDSRGYRNQDVHRKRHSKFRVIHWSDQTSVRFRSSVTPKHKLSKKHGSQTTGYGYVFPDLKVQMHSILLIVRSYCTKGGYQYALMALVYETLGSQTVTYGLRKPMIRLHFRGFAASRVLFIHLLITFLLCIVHTK